MSRSQLVIILLVVGLTALPLLAAEPRDGVGGDHSEAPLASILEQIAGDTALIRFQPMTLDYVADNPDAAMEAFVRCDVRFHRLEDPAGMPVHTRITPEDYVCFSAWDVSSRLWVSEDLQQTHPVFFIPRDLNHRLMENQEWRTIAQTPSFAELRIWGKVVSDFAGQPWIVVYQVSRLNRGRDLDEQQIGLMVLGVQRYNDGMKAKMPAERKQKFDMAADLLQDLVEQDPPEPMGPAAHDLLGRAMVETDQGAAAVPHLEVAVADDPQDPERALWLARACYQAGLYEASVAAADAGLRVSPMYFPLRLARGKAQAALGNFSEAVADLGNVIASNPREVEEAYLELGLILRQQGRDEEAVANFRAGLVQAPLMVELNRELVRLYMEAQNWDAVLSETAEVLRGEANLAHKAWILRELKLARATALLATGDLAKAEEMANAAAAGSPYPEAMSLQAAIKIRQNQDEQAVTILQNMAQLVPGDASVHLRLARLYRDELDDMEMAAAHYLHAVQIEPGNVLALNELADILDRLGQPERAAACRAQADAAGGN